MRSFQKLQLICGLIFIIQGCAPIKNSQFEEFLSQQSEVPECTTDHVFPSTTKVSGTAKFFKRGINLVVQAGEIKNMFLGDPLATALPIRFAEINVYNAQNKIIQCGLTDASGNLKAVDGTSDLLIPAISGTYYVRVLARTNKVLSFGGGKPDFDMHIAVKEDKYTNAVHYINGTVHSNGVDDASNLDMVAFARQTDSLGIEGGAFNILNSLQIAYQYLRDNTGTVDTTCMSDKLNVFWRAGFNPNQYLEPQADPENLGSGSFYIPADKSLYITGGKLGDVSIDVTNHFDDYVILHELGHHIETQCGQITSPGGHHEIIARIDPRLAWSEGWGNYFAAQVMFNQMSTLNPEFGPKLTLAGFSPNWTYLFCSKGFTDTIQNISNGSGFMFDFKKSGNNPDTWQYGSFIGNFFDRVDPTRYFGEGHFREGAIARGLFKLTNLCGGTCLGAAAISFENVWKSFDNITGAGQSIYPFKGSHTVMEILKTLVTPVTWAATYKAFNEAATTEALHLFSDGIFTTGVGAAAINRWRPYGFPLTTVVAGACPTGLNYIEPRSDDPVLTGTNSDQRYSNHYLTIDLNTLSTVNQINVTFTKQNPVGTTTEFDILLFEPGYEFNIDYYCSSSDSAGNCTVYSPLRTTNSSVVRSDRRSGAIATKTISNLQALDHSQKYLLNIRAFTPNRSISSVTDYSYIITDQSGNRLCP